MVQEVFNTSIKIILINKSESSKLVVWWLNSNLVSSETHSLVDEVRESAMGNMK